MWAEFFQPAFFFNDVQTLLKYEKMKKIILTLTFMIPLLLFSQEFGKEFYRKSYGNNIQIQNLLRMQQTKGDTIWLFHRYNIYKWEDGEFHLYLHVIVDYYFLSSNIKNIIVIENEKDTLYKESYIYDNSNRVISTFTQNYNGGTIINYQKVDQYYYTSTGYDSLYIFYKRNVNDTIWEKDKLRGIEYNEYGFTLVDTLASWDGQKWKIEQGGKNEFIINSFGNITGSTTIVYNPYINEWVKSFKYEYYIINDTTGEFNAYDIYFWKNGQWENGERYTDVILHNWQGWKPNERFQVEFLIQQLWDGYSWYIYKKDSLTYDDNGGKVYYKFVWVNGKWENANRVRDIWNNMKMRTLITREDWKNIEWDTIWADRYFYEYLGSIWKVMHYEAYDTSLMKWLPAYDHVLSDFSYILNTPETETNIKSSSLQIIPNPAKNSILIRLNDEADRIKTVRVYNVTGQRMFERKFHGKRQQEILNISSLQNGVYIINVTTRQGKMMKGKFVKN